MKLSHVVVLSVSKYEAIWNPSKVTLPIEKAAKKKKKKKKREGNYEIMYNEINAKNEIQLITCSTEKFSQRQPTRHTAEYSFEEFLKQFTMIQRL